MEPYDSLLLKVDDIYNATEQIIKDNLENVKKVVIAVTIVAANKRQTNTIVFTGHWVRE